MGRHIDAFCDCFRLSIQNNGLLALSNYLTLTTVEMTLFWNAAIVLFTLSTSIPVLLIDGHVKVEFDHLMMLIVLQWRLNWRLFESWRLFVSVWGCSPVRATECRPINDVEWCTSFCNAEVCGYYSMITHCAHFCTVVLQQRFPWEHIRDKRGDIWVSSAKWPLANFSGNMFDHLIKRVISISSLQIYSLGCMSLRDGTPTHHTLLVLPFWYFNATILLLATNMKIRLRLQASI